MLIHSYFGYVLGHDGLPDDIYSWPGGGTVFLTFVPRKNSYVTGLRFVVNPSQNAGVTVRLYRAYDRPLYDGAYSANKGVLSYSSGSMGNLAVFTHPPVFVAAGERYCYSLTFGGTVNIGLYRGPKYAPPTYYDARATSYCGLAALDTSNHTASDIGIYANAPVSYRMDDGSSKHFEPLLSGVVDLSSTNDLALRFSLPEGLSVRVDGVVVSHFMRVGNPGNPKFELRLGNQVLTETASFAEPFVPPGTVDEKSFYMAFTDSVLLTSGNTYDLRLTVLPNHDSSNRYTWKVLIHHYWDLNPHWPYRMVVGATERKDLVPYMVLFTLDCNSPFE